MAVRINRMGGTGRLGRGHIREMPIQICRDETDQEPTDTLAPAS